MEKAKCTREFDCDNGVTYMCHPKCCCFCDHCSEIVWDYTNGPYMILCSIDGDVGDGLQGECDKFKEE